MGRGHYVFRKCILKGDTGSVQVSDLSLGKIPVFGRTGRSSGSAIILQQEDFAEKSNEGVL